jgi:hypothetical protein
LHHQHNAKKLCFELSHTHPDDHETKQNIYRALFGNVGTWERS